jgi:hypothetical protein
LRTNERSSKNSLPKKEMSSETSSLSREKAGYNSAAYEDEEREIARQYADQAKMNDLKNMLDDADEETPAK